jgi:hypothetical protein
MQEEGLVTIPVNTQEEQQASESIINDLKTNYERKIKELQDKHEFQERQIHKLKRGAIDWESKYIYTKEQLDLLLYRKFARSAERAKDDDKQPLLFTSEQEPEPINEDEAEETTTEVKSHKRSKPGRKPINPNIRREEIIIDIA